MTTGDPTAQGRGNVGQGDVGLVATQWGAVSAVPNSIILPAAAKPGISTFTISMMVYIPASTTFAVGGAGADRMGLVVRWNGLQTSANSIYVNYDPIPVGTWTPITLTGTIPALAGRGNAVTTALPLISWNDREDNAAAGIAAYLDDDTFEVSVSEDGPNLPLATDVGFGDVAQNGGPKVKTIVLADSGTNEDLVISGATVSGLNAGFFSLGTIPFPLTLAPAETLEVHVTLNPGAELGLLLALIEFAGNDESSPTLTTNLSGNSVVPFEGKEFIVNGDFETGDLTGWRDNARIDATTDQARSGTTSAAFSLPGANQWNEARVEHLESNPVDSIPITPEMYGKEYFYSAWFRRPLTGGMADHDSCQTILRWNSLNPNNHTVGRFAVGTAPTDVWMRVTGSGVIPEIDSDGLPVTHLTILWSFQDVGSDSIGGELMYLDDVSFKIDVPPAPAGGPVITSIGHDQVSKSVTINYEGAANVNYAIDRSTGLDVLGEPDGWMEISDSEMEDATGRTYVDTGALNLSDRFFYRVAD
ncbi:MAG: hypothetical protein QNL33_02195 [Akkermansiaceae bacterium]